MTWDQTTKVNEPEASQAPEASYAPDVPKHLSAPHMPAATHKILRMSYRIGRGEQGVLTFEPYKSALLPHWRFRTLPIAKASSNSLWEKFLQYERDDDFVGMDMARKFIQMGMTRAKRYANHRGGRKYDKAGKELDKSIAHKDMREKAEASHVFREVWERCRKHEPYLMKKEAFQAEQRAWEKETRK
ncbi:MAG: hypothetical protein Q9182_000817 [Xanthomendoza sp. 2 TL-2023]